jgi:predicted nucleic acid-binding protein
VQSSLFWGRKIPQIWLSRLIVVRDEEFPVGRPVCRDPKDNQFLGLAFECEANVIVSSDEDLLVLDPWADTRILRPAEFLNELN